MKNGEVAIADSDSLAESQPPELAERPLLFLHIPKTAGTSLMLALKNLFGDQSLLRLDVAAAGERLAETVADVIDTRLDQIACLAGHLPMHLMAPHLERFRPFTLLREPVARVFSLYRFLRRAPEANLTEMGLRPGFGFEEFIASRRLGVFEQVNNGMCRMLTDDSRLLDPDSDLFWRIDPEPEHAERALAMLERLDFGLVEDMQRTRHLFQARWNLPRPVDEYRENFTVLDEPEPSMAHLQLVIRRNMLDLALYQRATALFHARAEAAMSGVAPTRSALFAPLLNVPAGIAEIAGRQGFHEAEPIGFAWLRADGPAHIHFAAPASTARIQLQFYCITEDYPIDRILVQVNGRQVPHHAEWAEPRWCRLRIGPIALRPEPNELAIEPPTFLSVRQYRNDSPDHRYLSVALATVTLLAEARDP